MDRRPTPGGAPRTDGITEEIRIIGFLVHLFSFADEIRNGVVKESSAPGAPLINNKNTKNIAGI